MIKNRSRLLWIYGTMFVFSLHVALTSFANSTLLTETFGVTQNKVGLIFAIASIFSLIFFIVVPRYVDTFSAKRELLNWILVHILTALVLAFTQNPIIGVIAYIVYSLASICVYFHSDLFIEHYSSTESTGTTRGLYLAIINSAWVIAPFIAGRVIELVNIQTLYLIGLALSAVVACMVLGTYAPIPRLKAQTVSFFSHLKHYLQNKDLRGVSTTNFTLNFFYATMVIYGPLYLYNTVGLSWQHIGLIFSIMLIAFPLLEWKLGKLADTKYGEKEIMAIGFAIASIATFAIALVTTQTWWVWAIIFFVSRVGAASIESMNETFFYKQVNESEIGNISIFRATYPFAYLIAPLVASMILFVTKGNLHIVFFVLSFIMLITTLVSLKLHDTK